MRVIAVDFDGTLCEAQWPGIGNANYPVINELILQKKQGDKVILWTCRTGKMLNDAVKWCYARGLCFDAINENLASYYYNIT